METVVVGVDNKSMEAVKVEVETDYDGGPYVAIVFKDAVTNEILGDYSVATEVYVTALRKAVTEATEKFGELLDNPPKEE